MIFSECFVLYSIYLYFFLYTIITIYGGQTVCYTSFTTKKLFTRRTERYLDLSLLTEATDGGSHGDRGSSVESISTARLGLVAALALPDADNCALHAELSAETAEVFGVLTNLNLLDLLTQRGTISGAVFTDNPDLFCTLRLQKRKG